MARYNVLSNGFIMTIASCEYGLPDHLFECGVRIRNHDLPLWEAREIVTSINSVIYYADIDAFINKVKGTPKEDREPNRAWKSRTSKTPQLDQRVRIIDK